MKNSRKILAGFMAAATMLTCTSFNLASAETSVSAEETTEVQIKEMGTLYIRKGGIKVLDQLEPKNVTIENEAVAVIEDYPYFGDMYQVRAIETGTTRVTYETFATGEIQAWDIVVEDYPETYELSKSELEISLNDFGKINIIDPYDDSYKDPTTGGSIYNDDAVWASDNKDVVRVELGRLYPQAEGTATVTAKLDGVVYECKVTVTPIVYQTGDVDMNEKINLYDAIFIAKYIMGMNELDEEQASLADYNGDNRVDLYDAIEISKTLLP